jgi:hypothetical protein
MDQTISYWTALQREGATLPSSHDGWFVVEVDIPDPPTREEPTAQSARWILAQPERMASA